jgi:hypothetical protein
MLDKKSSGKGRILIATVLLALLITVLAGTLLVSLASAYPTLSVELQSPGNDKAYDTNLVQLAFTYIIAENGEKYKTRGDEPPPTFTCYLDGKAFSSTADFNGHSYVSSLPTLSDGSHDLSIYVRAYYYLPDSDSLTSAYGYSPVVHFKVITASPRIIFLSIEPLKAYNTSTLSFDFTISQPAAWAGYSLDEEPNVTVPTYLSQAFSSKGHALLTGLSDGWHNIVFYAKNLVGEETRPYLVPFQIKTQETPVETEPSPTNPEPRVTAFPTTLVATIIVVSTVVVAIGFLFYFRKRKQ